jgi:hypothetical protein
MIDTGINDMVQTISIVLERWFWRDIYTERRIKEATILDMQ